MPAQTGPVYLGHQQGSVTGTMSSVSPSLQVQIAAGANPYRTGIGFYNNSGASCYLAAGPTGSITQFTKKLLEQEYFNFPVTDRPYAGQISVFWITSTTGSLQVTEYA